MKYWRLRTTIILCSLVIIAVGFMDFSFTTPDFSTLLPSPSPVKKTPRPIPSYAPLSPELVTTVVNDWRVREGLKPYSESKATCEVALARLEEIKGDFSHNGFSKYPPRYGEIAVMSENLAKGYATEDRVGYLIQDWVDSPSHKENLMKPYRHSCIKTEGQYIVQVFANF